MFKKKSCKKCGEKINKGFDFCPYCGALINPNSEDWGMLGKKDTQDPFNTFEKDMFPGLSGKMLNKMLGGAMKMLEKEFQKNIPNQEITSNTNFELYINGKKINPENIKVTRKPLKNPQVKKITQLNHFNSESLKKFSNLPKKEPSTNIRRLADTVVYEINLPGVNSIKDISIVKLEKSIEIKAIGKDKAYKKIITIDLPLLRYKLDKSKLVLELGVKS
ncbi:MAG: zinc ribbon domain-containing protein [archaeon]